MNRQLAAISYAYAISSLLFNVQPALIGVYQKNFGFDERQLGEVLGLSFFGACVVLGSSYFWINRVRCRHAIAVGVSVALAGMSIQLAATGFATVALGCALAAIGLAITAAPVVTIVGSMPNPTMAFGYAVSAAVVIASTCLYLIPVVLFPAWGFSSVMVLLMVLIAATFGVLPWLREPSAVAATVHVNSNPSGGLAWLGLIATLVYFAGLNSNWPYMALIGDRLQLPTEATGVAISVALLVGIVGSLAAAVINERLSIAKVMLITTIGFALYAGLLLEASTLGPSPWVFAIAATVFNMVWNFSLPYTMEAVRVHDQDGRLFGLVPAAQALGGAGGAFAGGYLMASTGPVAVFTFLIACTLASGLLFAWLEPRPPASAQ